MRYSLCEADNDSAGFRGFTLVELLVVMAAISVLACVLLPAFSKARAVARRTACINNLKQIGLALQHYEAAHGVLPPGSVNDSGPILTAPRGYHHGWHTMLLPYLDAATLYAALDPSVSIYHSRNDSVRSTVIPPLLCPSDPAPRLSQRDDDATAALTNYAGNHHPTPALIDDTNHGVLFLNSRVRFEDIVDGSSHTIFVGEFTRSAHDLGWASGTFASLRNGGPSIAAGPPTNANEPCGFSSHHDDISGHSFGDGSVRFIPSNIARNVYMRLLNRADGFAGADH